MAGLTTAMQTAFQGVQTNVLEILGFALPAALGIVAIVIAIKIGIRFFKSISNG